jgi:putative lipoic acid-binding regulatory protein
MDQNNESLMKFPCSYTIKVVGANSEAFKTAVYTIIHNHLPDLKENAFAHRPSKNDRYLSINITFDAQSKEQLDKIYQDLSSSDEVMMAL